MTKQYNLILAGVGGQGIVSAGQILAAAGMAKGYGIYALEEHGLARRGGNVDMFIRFGNEIFTPLFLEGTGDILIAFEPYEALRHMKYMNKNGIIFLNTFGILPLSDLDPKGSKLKYPSIDEIVAILQRQFKQIFAFNATSEAQKLGYPIVMGMILLGMVAASKVMPVPKKTFISELKDQLDPKIYKINLKAFEVGYNKFNEFK